RSSVGSRMVVMRKSPEGPSIDDRRKEKGNLASLAETQNSGWERQDGMDELEDRVDSDAEQPEWQRQQPDNRIDDERQDRQRQRDHRKEQPEQEEHRLSVSA